MKYLITNVGCDAITEAEIELNEQEYKIIERFCNILNKKSSYGCQPVIEIYDNYEYEEVEYENGSEDYYHYNNEPILKGRK